MLHALSPALNAISISSLSDRSSLELLLLSGATSSISFLVLLPPGFLDRADFGGSSWRTSVPSNFNRLGPRKNRRNGSQFQSCGALSFPIVRSQEVIRANPRVSSDCEVGTQVAADGSTPLLPAISVHRKAMKVEIGLG